MVSDPGVLLYVCVGDTEYWSLGTFVLSDLGPQLELGTGYSHGGSIPTDHKGK